MQNDHDTTIKARTHRRYDGAGAGTYLTTMPYSGHFMELNMTAGLRAHGSMNESAHFSSVVNDFGDLVCIKRFN